MRRARNADFPRFSAVSASAEGRLLDPMTAQDLISVQTLARQLTNGDLVAAMQGGPGLLLRHALASQLDHRYAIWLRLDGLTRHQGTSVRRSPAQLFKALRNAWHWARSGPNRQP